MISAGVAYVYAIEIHQLQRRRRFGRAAMVAAEDLVGNAGIGEIGLNVFRLVVAEDCHARHPQGLQHLRCRRVVAFVFRVAEREVRLVVYRDG